MHLASDINEAKRSWKKQIDNIQWGYVNQWRNVYFPAILPRFLIVAKNAWAMMWRILIAIEVLFGSISGGYGLGSWMMETKVDYALTETWSILIVIIIAGITINKIFDTIIKRIDW
jgi:NitT/TauT family transport system permease protein